MCEAVEAYARERAEEVAKEVAEGNARSFFMNGASMELVTASIAGLTRQRIQQIYDEVMSEKLEKV